MLKKVIALVFAGVLSSVVMAQQGAPAHQQQHKTAKKAQKSHQKENKKAQKSHQKESKKAQHERSKTAQKANKR